MTTTHSPRLPVEVDGLVPDARSLARAQRSCEHGAAPVVCGHCADGTRTGWVEVPPFGVRLLLSAEEARRAAAALLEAAGDLDDAPLVERVEGRLVVDDLLVGAPGASAWDLDEEAAALEAAARRLRSAAAHVRADR